MGPWIRDFSRDNWTSGIKDHVNLHPDYETMGPWNGVEELSDLEYHDTRGTFTAFMIQMGHLASERWRGKTPKYHFEVKSTPRGCHEQFYMSGTQYKKVRFSGFLIRPYFQGLTRRYTLRFADEDAVH